MEKIFLAHENHNGSEKKDPKSMALVKAYQEMEALRKTKKSIYIEILEGKYKGSIAKFVSDEPIVGRSYFQRKDWSCNWDTWRYEFSARGHFIWDGRKNKIKAHLWPSWESHPEYAWLKDYDGETKYELFDAKKAKEKALNNIKVKDIDGNTLNVGDKVLYVNIRYGSGADLTRGVIDRWETKVWPKDKWRKAGQIVFAIVKEDGSGEESKIEHSERLILKSV